MAHIFQTFPPLIDFKTSSVQQQHCNRVTDQFQEFSTGLILNNENTVLACKEFSFELRKKCIANQSRKIISISLLHYWNEFIKVLQILLCTHHRLGLGRHSGASHQFTFPELIHNSLKRPKMTNQATLGLLGTLKADF